MSFSEQIAKTVAEQLERFVTLNSYQLAGHLANLDFWLAQAKNALDVIDGYELRFQELKSGQESYIAKHKTTTWRMGDPEFASPPGPPRRVPSSELREARRAVVDAVYHFLIRLFNDGLIPESTLRKLCKDLDIGIDPTDLRQQRA